ncbi:MAG: Gmad2 immunoglobulin-like domain-containing protein [Anaerolineales bacterium]|nr:Gmad2 immunoglobulin-like domain-containing protein [Anaerolineales bacterium]
MFKFRKLIIVLIAALALAACQPATEAPTETPLPEPTMPFTETPPDMDFPAEAIYIESPAPGATVGSSIQIKGMAAPTFEQNLMVRVLAEDGAVLHEMPTTIQADAGQRGAFSADVPLELDAEGNIFV